VPLSFRFGLATKTADRDPPYGLGPANHSALLAMLAKIAQDFQSFGGALLREPGMTLLVEATQAQIADCAGSNAGFTSRGAQRSNPASNEESLD
jgi:hypothetical protein